MKLPYLLAAFVLAAGIPAPAEDPESRSATVSLLDALDDEQAADLLAYLTKGGTVEVLKRKTPASPPFGRQD